MSLLAAGCKQRTATPIALEAQTADLQGIEVRLLAPRGVRAAANQNRLMWHASGGGMDLQLDVVRTISGIELDGAAARIHQVFSSSTFLRDEKTPAGAVRVTHRSAKATIAHHFVQFGRDVIECMAEVRLRGGDADEARRLSETACDSMTLGRDAGIPAVLEQTGDSPRRPLFTKAPSSLYPPREATLVVDYRTHYGNQQSRMAALVSLRTQVARAPEGLVYTVTIDDVRVEEVRCGDRCEAGRNDETAVIAAKGRVYRLEFSETGQLQSARRDGAHTSSDFVAVLDDAFGLSTSTFPTEAVGAGASWTVIEPRDEKQLRRGAETPVRTRYTVSAFDQDTVEIVRMRGDDDGFRCALRFGVEPFPTGADCKSRTTTDISGTPFETLITWKLAPATPAAR
jgi:hypothetical protein